MKHADYLSLLAYPERPNVPTNWWDMLPVEIKVKNRFVGEGVLITRGGEKGIAKGEGSKKHLFLHFLAVERLSKKIYCVV